MPRQESQAAEAVGAPPANWPWRQYRKAGVHLVRVAVLAALSLPAWPQQKPPDLTSKSLEDLMNIEVTSVSKKEQKLSRTASAIFVITQDDIRRSGATNIPDLLRMVPGLDVGQINGSTWAISVRGFTEQFSNKLLVMVDSRTVYTPSFSGVYWDTLDLPLEDIERIEVIRGPGGTIWGANAVNGVIHIITKKAEQSQGARLTAGAGNLDQGFGTAQFGAKLGANTAYRVYAKFFKKSPLPDRLGLVGVDGWHMLRGGFRSDTIFSTSDTLTVEGGLYTAREGESTFFLPSVTSSGLQGVDTQVDFSGGFIQTAWNHTFSPRSDTSLQVSLDRYSRADFLDETRDTLNIDFQHHLAWGSRHDLIWGLGYRYTTSGTVGSFTISFNPAKKSVQLFNSFVQDEIALQPDHLYLTLGTKLEHNDCTGFVILPTARLTWSPVPRQMFWAAISRAVRTPSSADTVIRLNVATFPGPGGTPALVALLGNPNFKNENLTAYEAGYRAQFFDRLTVDLAAYFNSYNHLATTEPGTLFFEPVPVPPHFVLPEIFLNLMHGETHGLEIAANWKVSNHWTLAPGYAFEQIHMHTSPASHDTSTAADREGSSPRHSAQLRSSLALGRGLEWNASASFVDRLPNQNLPSHTRLDTGLDWQLAKRFSISLVGQNLLKDRHLEFVDPNGSVDSSYVKRSAYVKLDWQF